MRNEGHITIITGIIAALFLLGLMSVNARVFFRWRSSSNVPAAIDSLGGRNPYTADMSINGRPGTVSVIGMDMPFSQAFRALRKTFNITSFRRTGSGSATAETNTGKTLIRFVITQIRSKTIVFIIEQSADDAANAAIPDRHYLKAAPEYPGSTPVFFAADRGTGFSMATSSTTDSLYDIQSFYSDRLTSEGWARVIPTRQESSESGMYTYVRGNDLFCVHAARDRSKGESTIMLLHKINRTN